MSAKTGAVWNMWMTTAGETVARWWLAGDDDIVERHARALVALRAVGVEMEGRFRSLGAGRGEAVTVSQGGTYRGISLELEAHAHTQGREAALIAPPSDELCEHISEEEWWTLMDVTAHALRAEWGCVGDGAALDAKGKEGVAWARLSQRHPALLVPHLLAGRVAPELTGVRYRSLPHSRLVVFLH